MVSEFAPKVAFSQAILQSGAAPLNIRTLPKQQESFDQIVAFHKVDAGATPEEKVAALRKVSADEIVNSYVARGNPMIPWQCTVDDFFLKNPPTYTNLASQTYPKNIERLLLGDTTNEGLIFSHGYDAAKWDYERLNALATKILGPEKAKKVFDSYGVSAGLSPSELRTNGIHIISEAEWSQPVNAVAKSFKHGPVFYYHMSTGNPFDGPNKGEGSWIFGVSDLTTMICRHGSPRCRPSLRVSDIPVSSSCSAQSAGRGGRKALDHICQWRRPVDAVQP